MSKDTPLYLCIRIGKPKKSLRNTAGPGSRFSPIYSFNKKKYEREYWFSVPKDKAHNLFHFFKKWSPEIYGDVDDISGCEERGLEPITTDDEEEEEEQQQQSEARRLSIEAGEKSESENKELAASKPKFWRRRSPMNFLKLMEDTFSTEGMSTEWNVRIYFQRTSLKNSRTFNLFSKVLFLLMLNINYICFSYLGFKFLRRS